MSNIVLFQPAVQTRAGRTRLTRSLRVLDRLRENSALAAEVARQAATRLATDLRKRPLVEAEDLERLRVCYHILEDVLRQQWRITHIDTKARALQLVSPQIVEKQALRDIMAARRQEAIYRDREWIEAHHNFVAANLINGCELNPEKIDPMIEVSETKAQHTLFRYLRYTWSSPYSEYVGRRMRFLIRDRGHGGAIIGIVALGSSIMQIAERDQWIGWMPKNDQDRDAKGSDYWAKMRDMRAERIVAMMDMYVCGAIAPYSHLLGGKLICYMMMSNEVRDMFRRKYRNRLTVTRKRAASDLVLLVTTSLYGNHSSQYNRIRYQDEPLYKAVGLTRGYGTVHLSPQTFELMRRLLSRLGTEPRHEFGAGVNWKMRVVRSCLHGLGLDQDLMLQHSYPKAIYVSQHAKNAREFLRGESNRPNYFKRRLAELIEYWRERWLRMRVENQQVMDRVRNTDKSCILVKGTNQVT